jgi:phosphoribosylamine--glycine ligase
MRLLILGQGGREHTLFQKFTLDHPNEYVRIMPGNGGINRESTLPGSINDFNLIKQYIKEHSFDTILVGPEEPLVRGIKDEIENEKVFVFGPSKKAALLEGSKSFAKDFMQRHNIPTAHYRQFDNIAKAEEYLKKCHYPIVVKASGLAAGKGVTICKNLSAALDAANDSLSGKAFGEAGKDIVIEEFLEGREVSIFAVADGKHYQIIGTAQDYKRAYDDDLGPNTGGMGAFSPAVIINEMLMKTVREKIIEPTLSGMEQEGMPYTGILYLGIILVQDEPFVIEYNCRMGDPETQVVLPLLETPLGEILEATRDKNLDKIKITTKKGFAVTVVFAKEGYPTSYAKGKVIERLSSHSENSQIFHAGTILNVKEEVISNGGRVLNFTGIGPTLKSARENAYRAIALVKKDGFFYRKDIALNYL